MALNDREMSLLKAIGEEVSQQLTEMKEAHQQEVGVLQQRIKKMESEVEGLISLLGEN